MERPSDVPCAWRLGNNGRERVGPGHRSSCLSAAAARGSIVPPSEPAVIPPPAQPAAIPNEASLPPLVLPPVTPRVPAASTPNPKPFLKVYPGEAKPGGIEPLPSSSARLFGDRRLSNRFRRSSITRSSPISTSFHSVWPCKRHRSSIRLLQRTCSEFVAMPSTTCSVPIGRVFLEQARLSQCRHANHGWARPTSARLESECSVRHDYCKARLAPMSRCSRMCHSVSRTRSSTPITPASVT